MTMRLVYGLGAAAVLATILVGCAAEKPRFNEYPPFEGTGFTDRQWTQKEKLLAGADFSVELVRLTDDRNPRVEGKDPGDNLIYQYDPDQLVQGVSVRLPVLFNKFLAYRSRMPKHYSVEMEITRMKTNILNGTFMSGSFGRYAVELEARVIVRRSDSTVAINRPFSVQIEQDRKTFNGRSPSVEMDRTRMYDLAEDAVRQMSEAIGWEIRGTDGHRWELPKLGWFDKDTIPEAEMTVPVTITPTVLPPATTDIQG